MARLYCTNWKLIVFLLILFVFFAYYLFSLETRYFIDNYVSYTLPVTQTTRKQVFKLNEDMEYDEMLKTYHSPKFLISNFAVTARLGNNLFELVSYVGIARRLKRIPLFFIISKNHKKWLKDVTQVFPKLASHLAVIDGPVPPGFKLTHFPKFCCSYDDPKRLAMINDTFLSIVGYYFQSYKYFPYSRNHIINLLDQGKKKNGLPESNSSNWITCIHSRRTDFVKYKRFSPDKNFIFEATEFVDQKNGKKNQGKEKLIVIFGDDLEFRKSIFPNTTTHFVSKYTPYEDLQYASKNCDSVLITSPISTFGWWIGYLSGHDNVFYIDARKTNDSLIALKKLNPDDFFLPNWTSLWFGADNKTVVEIK